MKLEWLTGAALALLLCAAASAPLWRGGAPPEAQSLLCLACALALAVALLGAERPRAGIAWAAPALLVVLSALQCLPLPLSALRSLAPVNAELRALPPAPQAPSAPITLDAPATEASLAFAVALACAAAAAGVLAAQPRKRSLLLAAPLLAALPQAALGLARVAAGGGRLWGSFVNQNHAAALLMAGALTGLAIVLGHDHGRRARMAAAVAAALCGAAVLLTLSRGGTAALLGGAAALIFLGRSSRRAGALFALAAAALVAVALAGAELANRSHELFDDSKLRSFSGALALVRDHWLCGLGRGAYRFLSERHRSVPGEQLYVFAENEPLQLAAELGVPAALALLALCGMAWLRGLRRPPTALSRGALAALLALALHDLVDFDLELLGVALPAVIALGALAATPIEIASARARPLWARSGAALLALLIGGGAALVELHGARHSAELDGDRFITNARNAAVALPEVLAEARSLLAAHPADATLALAAAQALHDRAPRQAGAALLWVNRALQLGPGSPRAHALAAAILASSGARAQARHELRSALSGRHYQMILGDLVDLLARVAHGEGELWDATPDDVVVRAALAAKLRDLGRRDEARALVHRELARKEGFPTDRPVVLFSNPPFRAERAAHAQLLSLAAALAFEEQQPAAALDFAGRLQAEDASSCEAPLWRSRALRALGKASDGDAALREAIPRCADASALALELVEQTARARGPRAALDALERLSAESAGRPGAAEMRLVHAQLLEELGQRAQGLEQRWLAAQLSPEQPGLAIDYADRLLQAGERRAAAEALRSAWRRAPPAARGELEEKLKAIDR